MGLARLYIVFCFVFISPFITQAQPEKSWAKFYIHFRNGYGFIASHKSYTYHQMDSHFTTQEISIGKSMPSSSNWSKIYNIPEIGISYWYSNMGTSAYIKNIHALYPYIKFPLNHKNQFINHGIRAGVGLGYINDPFNLKTNYKNIMIGSRVNICGNVFYEIHVPIKKMAVSTAIGFTHFSNGAIKMPNLGINIPTLSIGLKFNQNQNNTVKQSLDSLKPNTKKIWYINTALGVLDYSIESNRLFPYSSVSIGHYLPINNKNSLEIGADLFYNSSNKQRLESFNIPVKNELQLIKPGLHASYAIVISHVSFLFQTGVYLYAKDKNDGLIFNRLLWHIQVSKKLFLSIALKTHFAKAECIEWGIGYTLNHKKLTKKHD